MMTMTFTGYLTRGRFEHEVEIEATYTLDPLGHAYVTTWTGADDLTGEELAQLDGEAAYWAEQECEEAAEEAANNGQFGVGA